MLTAVHFGAGNIGRGFLAQLYQESGYKIIFLDRHDDTIDKLKAAKSYKITQADAQGNDEKTITDFSAVYSNGNDKTEAYNAISRADVFTCSVGPRRLKVVGPILAEAINRRDPNRFPRPLAVIACENDQNATDHLVRYVTNLRGSKEEIARKVEFANCTIDRIVPDQSRATLNVLIEKYFEWTIEKAPFKHGLPPIRGVNWVDKLAPYLERKLFTVNAGHASTAYLGWAADIATIHEALGRNQIRATVEKVLSQNAVYLQAKYGFPEAEQEKYIAETINRFRNPALNDSCVRVARDPMRKLSHHERLMKPAKWLAENKHPFDGLLTPIEQAFRFQEIVDEDTGIKDETSFTMAEIFAKKSIEEAVNEITGLKRGDKLYRPMAEIVQRVKLGEAAPGSSQRQSMGGRRRVSLGGRMGSVGWSPRNSPRGSPSPSRDASPLRNLKDLSIRGSSPHGSAGGSQGSSPRGSAGGSQGGTPRQSSRSTLLRR